MQSTILARMGLANEWLQEGVMAVLALALGFGLLPLLIYQVGRVALGSYEGASVARLYDTVYRGLGQGSLASWIVVFGPYGIYLIFKGLRLWWQAGARPA